MSKSTREHVNPRTAAMARSRGKDYYEGWEDGVRSLDAEIARLWAGIKSLEDESDDYFTRLQKAEAVVRAAEDVHGPGGSECREPISRCPLCAALAAYRERA